MKNIYVLVFAALLNACSIHPKEVLTCDLAAAKKMAEKQLKRKGFDMKRKFCEVKDSAGYFFLVYLDTAKYVTGGGGDFIIEKKSCKIIKVTYYQ